ncbi:MAG: peptidase [Jatrophihabitans sp.]|nr:MAG: peptidase [Jatrophihabitans sp.]
MAAQTSTTTAAGASLALPVAIPAVGCVAILLGILGGGAVSAPPAYGCAGGGAAQTVAGLRLDAEQMGNAATITSVAASLRLPAYASTVALATAYQESRLINSTAQSDHDSEGLFQQRVSIYTAAVASNPVRATTAFLTRLVQVPGWQAIPLTTAAAAVQRPREDLRDAYAQWEPLAQQLTALLWPTAAATTAGAPVSVACPPDRPLAGPSADNVAGTTTVPSGLVITGTAKGRAAVRFALAQLGKPYVFGAAGPDAYDCSGLTTAAWASVGVALPHWTVSQSQAGTPVGIGNAVGGDLVFIPGSDGTAQAPGHVGMVVGYVARADGPHLYLLQAPMTGVPVELTEVSQWSGQIVTVRHIA